MVRTKSVFQMLCGHAECFSSLFEFPFLLQHTALCKVRTADVAGRRAVIDRFPEECKCPVRIGGGVLGLVHLELNCRSAYQEYRQIGRALSASLDSRLIDSDGFVRQ